MIRKTRIVIKFILLGTKSMHNYQPTIRNVFIFLTRRMKVLRVTSTYASRTLNHHDANFNCFLMLSTNGKLIISIVYLLPSIPSSGNKLYHAMAYGLDEIQRNILS